ncbi:Deoxyguanosinetriphosphate triphosphohydrolase [uncultured Flavonifractor sp.]|uniref:Deoxyguanosinetriphosphate triphosphohydrolase-like protein n=1 Tax=Flintibacter hominis TaxID=2763048 RepID=A0A8J6J8X3_9FIRM|nr:MULTISPECIES: deoxyguanosinetriphosphate triphosphohydrolase [Eubacteriales]MBS5591307.1 deoxyguanosinetriphosphate triphosphohydrolase [Clostridiales bacterium]SCG99322.1 Deoxyguanosinetriphosphate triphosphohydrolase [uncultured Clostridium sp.]SCI11460.1 Deoxyguanosinetriphosphate triphosphohydrolase [uncultured Flavonifractor sp.]MBC5722577.1 deoxyguanosinetriphosphate triphosphohydrolase [Flintibacter hominis]MCU6701593.1 deoxyguanosinetriphosphate triphosphohydrolase [Muriventricola a
MTLREQTQRREDSLLSPFACRSAQSRGRARQEKECDIRTPFQRDIDRIVYSKAFRRLKHKTQVFLQPEGDHYRTRMTHTLEVSRIARTIARALDLNEDLTEAIALGHDLGHTPFGHAGERMLAQLMPEGFAHYQQSVRVVDRLEKNGQGLNLTWEVRNGILCHTKGTPAATLEGQVVRLADHIAYINHDIEDALRGGVIFPMDIPLEVSNVLGFTHGDRINTLVHDAITASQGQDHIVQSHPVEEAMLALKDFMFASVYTNPLAKGEEGKAQNMLQALFQYYQGNPDELPSDFQTIRLEDGVDRAVCDYIAGMTDPFAVEKYKELFIPKGWTVL